MWFVTLIIYINSKGEPRLESDNILTANPIVYPHLRSSFLPAADLVLLHTSAHLFEKRQLRRQKVRFEVILS